CRRRMTRLGATDPARPARPSKASPAGIGDVGTWSCPPGVATATARTEYGRWRRTHRAADEGQFFVMFRPSVGEVASCPGKPFVRLLAVPGVTAAQRCVAIDRTSILAYRHPCSESHALSPRRSALAPTDARQLRIIQHASKAIRPPR